VTSFLKTIDDAKSNISGDNCECADNVTTIINTQNKINDMVKNFSSKQHQHTIIYQHIDFLDKINGTNFYEKTHTCKTGFF
jgi:hypothetical protein